MRVCASETVVGLVVQYQLAFVSVKFVKVGRSHSGAAAPRGNVLKLDSVTGATL